MKKDYQRNGTGGMKETTGITAPGATNTLSVNVFTAPGKAMVGERPKPFAEVLGFPQSKPTPSKLINKKKESDEHRYK
jgi:hypothetical protein